MNQCIISGTLPKMVEQREGKSIFVLKTAQGVFWRVESDKAFLSEEIRQLDRITVMGSLQKKEIEGRHIAFIQAEHISKEMTE